MNGEGLTDMERMRVPGVVALAACLAFPFIALAEGDFVGVSSDEAAGNTNGTLDAFNGAEEDQPAAGFAVASGSIDPETGEHPIYHLRPEPFSDEEALLVTLNELLELGIANNIGLRLQGFTIERGHYSVDLTHYAFDPSYSTSLNYSQFNRGGTAAAAGGGVSGSESYSARTSYSIPRGYGDAFQLGYDLSRSSYSLIGGGETTSIPTTYSASYSIGYTRPLARGAGKYIGKVPLYLASNNLALAYDRLDDRVRQLKKSIIDTYYQAIAARQGIEVREANLDLALKQLERAVERFKVGLAIQADVLQAENSVLSQRSTLLTAQNTYASLIDSLSTLVGLPIVFNLALDTEGALLSLGEDLPDELWELVCEHSFELKSLNSQLDNLYLVQDQQLDRLKHNVGLSLSYGRSGEDETFSSAVTGYENENYQVGITWSGSRGKRGANASLAQTELDVASLELQIQDAEFQLVTALRGSQRDLAAKSEQIKLAASNLDVLRETYNIAKERNEVGLATTLDVVEAQEKVLAGELALLQARVAYHETYRQLLLMAGLI